MFVRWFVFVLFCFLVQDVWDVIIQNQKSVLSNSFLSPDPLKRDCASTDPSVAARTRLPPLCQMSLFFFCFQECFNHKINHMCLNFVGPSCVK